MTQEEKLRRARTVIASLTALFGGLSALTHSWIARGVFLGFLLMWIGFSFAIGNKTVNRCIKEAERK